MLYILEGCDGVGKTTLANQLAPLLNAEVIHCTAETPNDFDFFHEIITVAANKNIIADRFCYGQFVYQEPVERPLTEAELRKLETEMLWVGAKLIYVTSDTPTVMDRLIYRGEKTSIPVDEIKKRFSAVLSESILTPFVWKT